MFLKSINNQVGLDFQMTGPGTFALDPESSEVVVLSELEELDSDAAETEFSGSTLPRFTEEITNHLRNQPSDMDRCHYIFGLGRANVDWPQDRSLEHLEALFALVSFVGMTPPDNEQFFPWETHLYPLTILTDAWIVIGNLQFGATDLLNWGFSREIASGFNEVLSVLKAARKYDDIAPDHSWAVVIAFLMGTLAERGNDEAYQSGVESVESILNYLDAPEGMRTLVKAHWQGQLYPGH